MPSARQFGMNLPRPAWVRLNRLRTGIGIGRFQLSMHKKGLAPTSICECDALDQTAVHVILESPLYCALRGYHELLVLDDEIRCWLSNITANIRRRLPTRRNV